MIKNLRVLKKRDLLPISIMELRNCAEMVVEKFSECFVDFEPEDSYRIFFPKNARKDQERINRFRAYLVYALCSLMKLRTNKQDLALVLRFKNESEIKYFLRKIRIKKYPESPLLEQAVHKILESSNIAQFQECQEYIVVSTVISQRKWERLVPKECLEMTDRIFFVLEQETGLGKNAICNHFQQNRKMLLVVDVFVYCFLAKYPNATEMFLAYLLQKKYHTSVLLSIKRQYDYLHHSIVKHSEEALSFRRLADKVLKLI